jgi:hypothetical protein
MESQRTLCAPQAVRATAGDMLVGESQDAKQAGRSDELAAEDAALHIRQEHYRY